MDVSSKKTIKYIIKFISAKHQVGTRETNSYKSALKEAEDWVLSGKSYTCVVEWSTFTGNKSMTFDHYSVQRQRKDRNTYKESLKKNLFRKPYVEL